MTKSEELSYGKKFVLKEIEFDEFKATVDGKTIVRSYIKGNAAFWYGGRQYHVLGYASTKDYAEFIRKSARDGEGVPLKLKTRVIKTNKYKGMATVPQDEYGATWVVYIAIAH
jgi:hypothetical protein